MRTAILGLSLAVLLAMTGCGGGGGGNGYAVGDTCDYAAVSDAEDDCVDRCLGDCDECDALEVKCGDRCDGCGSGLYCSDVGVCVLQD